MQRLIFIGANIYNTMYIFQLKKEIKCFYSEHAKGGNQTINVSKHI